MMHTLEPSLYERVRPLVGELSAYNVSIPALLDGINPGRVFVDDPAAPQAAFIESVEGFHLAGNPQRAAFIQEVNAYLRRTHLREEGSSLYLCVDPPGWVAQLPALFAPRPVQTLARRHYVCHELRYRDYTAQLPPGFRVRPIDAALLSAPEMEIPAHSRSWIAGNWGTPENYQERGFGFCVTEGQRVVCWSIADCASGARCEIGIHTHRDYRRRGLAAITTAAAVDHALSHGCREVGWHCSDDNIGSWKTAEKVGFRKSRDYVMYYCR